VFEGKLADFVEQHVKPNLLSPKGVAEFHKGLMEYINSDEALYILRQMGETVRFRRGIEEKIYSTKKGVRFKVSDNHPAWWIHYLIFNGTKFYPGNRFQNNYQ